MYFTLKYHFYLFLTKVQFPVFLLVLFVDKQIASYRLVIYTFGLYTAFFKDRILIVFIFVEYNNYLLCDNIYL